MLNNAGKSFGVDAVIELRAFADRWLGWLSHHAGGSMREGTAKVLSEISLMTRNYILYISFGVMVLITLFMHLTIHALFRIEHPTEMSIMLFSVHVLLFVGMMLMAWAPAGDRPAGITSSDLPSPISTDAVRTPGLPSLAADADPLQQARAAPLISSPTPAHIVEKSLSNGTSHPCLSPNQQYCLTLANVSLDHASQVGGHLSYTSHKSEEYPVLQTLAGGTPATHIWKFTHVIGTPFWHIYCERLTPGNALERSYLGGNSYRDPLSTWVKLTDVSSAIQWRVLTEHRSESRDDIVYIFVDSEGRTLCSHVGHNPPLRTTWVNMHKIPFTSLKSAHWHVTPAT
jgi:hypothetical protein